MISIVRLYEAAVRILTQTGIETPEIDAAAIVSHFALGGKSYRTIDPAAKTGWTTAVRISLAVKACRKHKPVAYITGQKAFYRDTFFVSPKCLIPRPDTEHLIYTAERLGAAAPFESILDIGTGSGVIAVSLARVFPRSSIDAIDVDIRSAARNLKTLGTEHIRLIHADMMGWNGSDRQYDLVVSNPPYLTRDEMRRLDPDVSAYEPHLALYGGGDGMQYYRRIAELCTTILKPGGTVILETDTKWRQVIEIFEKRKYIHLETGKDYNGLERTLVFSKGSDGGIK